MSMTVEERLQFEKKLALLDVIFQHMDIEELQKTVDEHHIIDKLAGTKSSTGPITTLWTEHQLNQSEIFNLKNQIYSFKADFKMLLEAIDKPYSSGITQMSNLKSRYQVY